MAFIPHSQQDIAAMLKTLNVKSVNDLFDEIPKDLRSEGLSHKIVPAAINEMEAAREFSKIAKQDETTLCFIGAGSYEHHIPAAVWDVVSRGEILTAYTPYQAEASQGTLQIIYEYQTMMASLMGLDCSNASLYDGASALAEAVLMAVRCHKKTNSKKILMPTTMHPFYRETVHAIVNNQAIEMIELPYCTETGTIKVESLNQYHSTDIAALVISQPNFFGNVEDVDALTNWAHQHNILVIACVNPLAMALLKEPGNWGNNGADIACGSGQPFGIPLASGGPYFGFLCCKQEFIRQMPGRIVGRTVDTKGRQGFALTLQAREQHIRRSKATSNICTNQGLLMTAATIHMSLLGPEGLKQVASVSHTNTKKLITKLEKIPGIKKLFTHPYFHEIVIQMNTDVDDVITALAMHGIEAGFSLKKYYPELGDSLLVCVTETKTDADLDVFVDHLESAMSKRENAKSQRREDAKI